MRREDEGVMLGRQREDALDVERGRHGSREELLGSRRAEPAGPVGPTVKLDLQRQIRPAQRPTVVLVGERISVPLTLLECPRRIVNLLTTARDELPLRKSDILHEKIEVDEASASWIGVAQRHLRPFEEDDLALVRDANAGEQRRDSEPDHHRSSLVPDEIGRDRSSERAPTGGGHEVDPVHPESTEVRCSIDEPIDSLPDRHSQGFIAESLASGFI
jgi:hypothetical protein